MEERVDRFVQKHRLLTKGATVVVGVSGGPDSMALLHYLLTKKGPLALRIVVAHMNHMLRAEQSETDYAYVEAFSEKHDLVFVGEHVDVGAYQRERGLTTQVAARECRYAFFKEVMKRHRASLLALGHHGDDQVETMLMRLTRGSAGEARAGIPVKRPFAKGFLIRPLLAVDKADIERYLKQVGITPRYDPTNERDSYVRNRFRRTVLPFLKRENPKVHERFQQQSEEMFQDELLLRTLAEEQLERVLVHKGQEEITVSRPTFLSLSLPLQRRVIQLLLNCLYDADSIPVTNVHVEQVRQLFAKERPSGTLHFPKRLYVIRSYDLVTFSFTPQEKAKPFYKKVHAPFEIKTPLGKLIGTIRNTMPAKQKGHVFIGDAEMIEGPLTIRTRAAGDRMDPLGMTGSKKLKAIFIDEKVEHAKRDALPIIADANGKILWVASVKRSKYGLVTDKTRAFIHIIYEENGTF